MRNLDTILAQRVLEGRYIKVGVVGGGTMGRMIVRHLSVNAPGIRVCAIANRSRARVEQLCSTLHIENMRQPRSAAELDQVVYDGQIAIVEDAMMLCRSQNIDVLVEVTGTIEFGAKVALEAINHSKHVVLVNAELDSTLGPILKQYADRHGVVLTNTDGDEPGVAMTLLRYLRSNGLKAVAAGNLKGMIDRYRTPETQRAFALKHNQDPMKVTSFADGTKLSMEAAVLSNASGFPVGQRGMYGPACTHVNEIAGLLPEEQMLGGGLVDYALGAEPHTGAFVIVHESDPERQNEMAYFKMGKGPFFVFYTPYHLPQVQVASTIARAAVWHDPTVAPLGGPVCEVVAVAKRDLRSGERLDGIGGFMSYGTVENSWIVHDEDLLPMGMSEGCVLLRDVRKDDAVRLRDVEIPERRLIDKLWSEQKEMSLLASR